jgi:hypothetical protein
MVVENANFNLMFGLDQGDKGLLDEVRSSSADASNNQNAFEAFYPGSVHE